jgi:hypothetical protein
VKAHNGRAGSSFLRHYTRKLAAARLHHASTVLAKPASTIINWRIQRLSIDLPHASSAEMLGSSMRVTVARGSIVNAHLQWCLGLTIARPDLQRSKECLPGFLAFVKLLGQKLRRHVELAAPGPAASHDAVALVRFC